MSTKEGSRSRWRGQACNLPKRTDHQEKRHPQPHPSSSVVLRGPSIELHEAIEIFIVGQRLPAYLKKSSNSCTINKQNLRSTSSWIPPLHTTHPTSGRPSNPPLCSHSTKLEAQFAYTKNGWIFSCAHCFAEDEGEYKSAEKQKWLLFYMRLAVLVECRVWDPKRDSALCKITTVQSC